MSALQQAELPYPPSADLHVTDAVIWYAHDSDRERPWRVRAHGVTYRTSEVRTSMARTAFGEEFRTLNGSPFAVLKTELALLIAPRIED